MVRSTTQRCLRWPRKSTVLPKKGTNLIGFMVNTNVCCRRCLMIRNIWCWTLDSKVEVSTSIYAGIGTPFVTQQPLLNLVIQSSSFAKSACIESNIDLNVDGHSLMLNSHLQSWGIKFWRLRQELRSWTSKLNVVIYFDFWRDWYVFGYSTINLMIQSSSFAESACIESNVDQ